MDNSNNPKFIDCRIDSEVSEICEDLCAIIKAKNHDYNYAFYNDMQLEGKAAVRIMLRHKFSRYDNISRLEEDPMIEESEKDTLMDLAGYAINALAAIRIVEKANRCNKRPKGEYEDEPSKRG